MTCRLEATNDDVGELSMLLASGSSLLGNALKLVGALWYPPLRMRLSIR